MLGNIGKDVGKLLKSADKQKKLTDQLKKAGEDSKKLQTLITQMEAEHKSQANMIKAMKSALQKIK